MACCDRGYDRPSLRAVSSTSRKPGVLGCRTLRRTVQVRLGSNPAARGTVARWHNHLHGLATAIHETSGLETLTIEIEAKPSFFGITQLAKQLASLHPEIPSPVPAKLQRDLRQGGGNLWVRTWFIGNPCPWWHAGVSGWTLAK